MRVLAVVPAVAALAWLSMAAVRSGTAGTIAYDAAREMASWDASGSEPGKQTVEWVAADLDRARAAAPGDASIEEMLGLLAMRRTDRSGYLDEALAHFSRAAALRPTSPYTWADIVDAKYRAGDTGPVFESALRRAQQMGPAEPEVQRTVADFGLATWDQAGTETRAAVEAAITGAMRRDAPETLQIAQRRGRLAIACRHLGDAPRRVDPRWSQLCGREATQ